MKGIALLIVASLLVVGLLLPGCVPVTPVPPAPELNYTFTGARIRLGIAGEVGHATGDMAGLGALLAAGHINALPDKVNIGGVPHTIELVTIDTDEASDPTGETGRAAMLAAIDNVDFVIGGFRTEAVEVYREIVMDAQKFFFNTGAATEALQHSVVTNYSRYKFWFKVTPYNEHFLAKSVLRMLDSTARAIRAACNLSANATLRAVIISEDLKWARDEQVPALQAGLPALNIALRETYLVSALDPVGTVGALTDIVAKGHDPHIIIPIYSGTMGAVYAGHLRGHIGAGTMAPMSVGINVMTQLRAPWTGPGTNLTSPPPGGPHCLFHVSLDTWATDLAMTDRTLLFLSQFEAAVFGEYPLYTAATYDAIFTLKAALESEAYLVGGVGQVKADDLIAFLQNPTPARIVTTGRQGVFPMPAVPGVNGTPPALTSAQVSALYPHIGDAGFPAYNVDDWRIPPHTAHDILYGPGWVTGVGVQWQWNATAGRWFKYGVWPRIIPGADLRDQYGDWNFQYDGTRPLLVPPWTIARFAPPP